MRFGATAAAPGATTTKTASALLWQLRRCRGGWFAEAVVNRGGEADGGERALGGFFEADEDLGADDALEARAAEVGNREDFFDLEAGLAEDVLDILGMVVEKTVGVEVLEAGGLEVERVDVGFFEPVAEHFGEGAFVGNLNHGDAAWAEDAEKLVGDFLHVGEVVGGADHHEGVEAVVFEGERVDVAGLGFEARAVKFPGLGEFGFGVVKESGGGGAGEVFVGEAPITAGNVYESLHMLGQELADSEAVGQVFVFAVGVLPEDFFVVVAVVVGDNLGSRSRWRGGASFSGFSGGFIRSLRWFRGGLFASCHGYHYNIKAKKREPWGEALLGEKGLWVSSLLAIFVGFGET